MKSDIYAYVTTQIFLTAVKLPKQLWILNCFLMKLFHLFMEIVTRNLKLTYQINGVNRF